MDSRIVLWLFPVQQLLLALLSARIVDGLVVLQVSGLILSLRSTSVLVLGFALNYWVNGIGCAIAFLCFGIFARRSRYFLTSFESTIVLVLSTLCFTRVLKMSHVSVFDVQAYTISSSMLFIQIAYVCIVAGCFATWCSFESVLALLGSNNFGRQWLIKLALFGLTVAIAVYFVDAVSMISWMLCLVFHSENGLVVKMCVFWSILISLTVRFSSYLSSLNGLKKTIIRKLFHLLAFLLFTPALLLELHSFLCLSMGLVLCLFILLEFLRVYVFADFASDTTSSYITLSADYFTWFAHKKELQQRNGVVLSHVTLLSGCAYSIYLFTLLLPHMRSSDASTSHNGALRVLALRLLPYLGIVSVCIADSLASVCGSLWGVKKWRSGGGRTVLGSVAAFLGMLTTCVALLIAEYYLHCSNNFALSLHERLKLLMIVVVVSVVTTLAEAFTLENDNLVLPYCSSCSYLLLIYLFL